MEVADKNKPFPPVSPLIVVVVAAAGFIQLMTSCK
jgi:hypothetical protein